MDYQRKAVYIERRYILDVCELKKQVIGNGERTTNEIVEAYVNPGLPSEEGDVFQLLSRVNEFFYMLEDLQPDPLQGFSTDDLKVFLQEQLRNAYDLKEGQIEELRPGLMLELERFIVLQQVDSLWHEHLQAIDAIYECVGLHGYGQKDL